MVFVLMSDDMVIIFSSMVAVVTHRVSKRPDPNVLKGVDAEGGLVVAGTAETWPRGLATSR